MKSFVAAVLVLTVFVGPALAANQTGNGTNGNAGSGVSGSTGNQGGGATGNAGGISGGQGGSVGGSTGSDAGAPGGASGNAGTSGSSAGASGGASSGNAGGAGAGASASAGSAGFSPTIFSGKAPVGVRIAGKTFTIAPTRTLTAHQVMTWTVFKHCADPAVRIIALYPDGGFRFMNYDHLSNLPVWRTAECMTAYGYEFHGMAFGGKTNFVGRPLDLGPQAH